MTTLDTLHAIERRDPDGWAHREPNAADYAAFMTWAVDTYGARALRHYYEGGWEPSYDW